jgi:HEAT repeat protein
MLVVTSVVLTVSVAEWYAYEFSEARVRQELRYFARCADEAFGPNARSSGVPYLVDRGEHCHDALLSMLEKVDKKKLRVNKDVHMSHLFEVLTKQTCDRGRFLPFAEKYALTDRSQTKLSEDARRGAIKLLGQIGTPDHVEKLIPLLQEDEKSARQEALAAVRALGDRRHAKLVLDQLGAPRPNLPPLTEAEQAELIAASKHLNTVPEPKK